ncbi:MAG: 50S ribosomal protein L11 methyltransferase [FCB group bacterium]|nr:50S ribosomal protein L11 methyltransferase [FCB group bacterium]
MSIEPVQSYQEIEIDVAADDREAVANYIIENISNGLVIEDDEIASTTRIKFYIASELDIKSRIDGLKKYLAAIEPQYASLIPSQTEIKNRDWIETYQNSVTAFELGDSIIVKPPWDGNNFPDRMEIILEPKMAFGTGRHETTRSCLAELEKLNLTGVSMLDFGCGSGILSIFAGLKGAGRIAAYDNNPLAVENSRENFILNKTDQVCRADCGTIDLIPFDEKFDIVVANIIKEVILPILDQLKNHVKPGGRLLLSGFMDQDQTLIEKSLKGHDLNDYDLRRDGEWLTYNIQLP